MKRDKYLNLKIIGFIFVFFALLLSIKIYKRTKTSPFPNLRDYKTTNQIEPWMTISFISKAHKVPPEKIISSLKLKVNSPKDSIDKIAKINNLSIAELTTLLNNYFSEQKSK